MKVCFTHSHVRLTIIWTYVPVDFFVLFFFFVKVNIIFNDEHDEAVKSTAYAIQANCIGGDLNGLCYDAGQQIRNEDNATG